MNGISNRIHYLAVKPTEGLASPIIFISYGGRLQKLRQFGLQKIRCFTQYMVTRQVPVNNILRHILVNQTSSQRQKDNIKTSGTIQEAR